MRDFLLEAADDDFLKWLEGNGYFTAPASKSHHGSEEGALYEHSLQVAYELISLTEKLGLKWQRKNSPQIIGMLHDVCKMDDYLIREEVIGATIDGGKIYGNPQVEWNKERIWPGHGEKSLDHADGAHQPHGRGENVHQVSHGILHRQQRVGVLFQGRENISECALYAHGRYDCITDKRSLNR